jgi:hypothetical protein
MSAQISRDYDEVVALLGKRHANVDPFLILKSSWLGRKNPAEKVQRFWLDIHYMPDVDEEYVTRTIQSMVDKMPTSHGHRHYDLVLQTDLDTVLAIARQQGIEWVGGEVYPNT